MYGWVEPQNVIGEPTGDKETDLRRGLIAAAILPLASVAVAAAAGRILNRMGPIPAILGGAFLLKSMFAIRGMTDEAAMVDQDLIGRIFRSRPRVAFANRLAGRLGPQTTRR